MVSSAENRLLLTGLIGLILAAQPGCANGPISNLAALNPFLRESDAGGRFGPTPAQQVAAIRAIGDKARGMDAALHEQTAIDLSRRLNHEPDPLLREELIDALAAFEGPTASAALKQALRDKETEVRLRAVRAWSRRSVDEAVPVLAETLASDTDLDVRLAATRALGGFRDPAAVRPLSLALEDPNPALQYRAVQSLKKITDRDFGQDLETWRRFARGDVIESQSQPSLVNRWLNDRF